MSGGEPMTNLLLKVERRELPALIWAFVYFFSLLCSTYILRPVRDEMGVQTGVDKLQWLFTGTFLAMIAFVPAFGRIAARWPRARFISAVYYFFAAALVLFFVLLKRPYGEYTAAAFFIFHSVFNIAVVSVFWSLLADLFSNDQARRMYGMIAAGGSLGAIAGPTITALLVKPIGLHNLLLIAAGILLFAVVCVTQLLRWAQQHGGSVSARDSNPLGGSMWAGVPLTLSSKYLGSIALFVFLLTVMNTFMYFEQARVVKDAIPDSEARTQLFAQMDLAVNSISIFTQFALVGALIGRLGVAGVLGGLMLLNVAGFSALAAMPTLAVLVAFQVFRRATDYSLIRPVREVLFTVVSREEKYKAKNFIDTAVFRGGDAVSGWISRGIHALGATTAQVAIIAVPVAAVTGLLGWFLGRRQEAQRQASAAPQPAPAEGSAD
jgi:ATP:ADP antiporter, AAA family